MPAQTRVDYTTMQTVRGRIGHCPKCGKQGRITTRPNGDRIFLHRCTMEDIGGITITHPLESCYVPKGHTDGK